MIEKIATVTELYNVLTLTDVLKLNALLDMRHDLEAAKYDS